MKCAISIVLLCLLPSFQCKADIVVRGGRGPDHNYVEVLGSERELSGFCARFLKSLCGEKWKSHATPSRQFREFKKSLARQPGDLKRGFISVQFEANRKAFFEALAKPRGNLDAYARD